VESPGVLIWGWIKEARREEGKYWVRVRAGAMYNRLKSDTKKKM
jgi:hypothetical protein